MHRNDQQEKDLKRVNKVEVPFKVTGEKKNISYMQLDS